MATPPQCSRPAPNTPPTLRLDCVDMKPETPRKGSRSYAVNGLVEPLEKPTLSESPDLSKNKRRITTRHGAHIHQQSNHSRTSGANGLRTSFHHRGVPLTASLRSGNQSISEGTPGTPFSLLAPLGSPPSPNASTSSTRMPQINGWFANQFKIMRELGSGQYGHVVLARHGLDDQSYAVKVIDTAVNSQFDLRRRITEARVLARCNSPYIMRYYSCWLEEAHIYIQTEFCAGGTLSGRMETYRKAGQRWEEREVTDILRQIAIGLSHLHSKVNAVHLDIKPDNIYIGADKRYKLGDFGHAHFLDDDCNGVTAGTRISCDKSLDSMVSRPDYRFSVEEGDIRYLPLEMLNDKTRLREADIFSLGMSLYEAASGIQLPNGSDPRWRKLREMGVDRERLRKNRYSASLISVIELMMSPDLGKRPTTSQLISYAPDAFATQHSQELAYAP